MQRYKSAAGRIFSLKKTHDYMISVARQIRHEMKEICSLKHNSVLCTNFEQSSNINPGKDYHSVPSFERDLQRLKDQLVAEQVFNIKEGRDHQQFSKHDQFLSSVKWKMNNWVKQQN